MRPDAIGVALIVVGLALLAMSLIPIPSVEFVPKTVPVPRYVYTTVKRVWLDEEFVVPPLSAKAYCGSFPSGTTLVIYIDVVSGGHRDINFWVMDERAWYHFQRGESFYYYIEPSRRRVTEAVITWSPPPNKEICFVYDNMFSIITSKTVYTKIVVEYKTYTITTTYSTTYVQKVVPHTLSHLAIPGILVFIAGVGVVVASRTTKH